MTKLPLIANPAAGGGRCGAMLDSAVARLRDKGVHVDVQRTTGPGHATVLARAAWASGHRKILCAGGDGTTWEVVNGLFPVVGDARPTLATIPLGTGNSFLKDFGVKGDGDVIAAIVEGRSRPVDVVRTTHAGGAMHYVNLLSIGFTSKAGATTNKWFKPLGAGGYAVATVIEVARLRSEPFPHRLDGGAHDLSPYVFLSFSNSRCTGGDMQMAPDADPTDGALDVIRVGDLTRRELLTLFPRIYQGKHLQHPKNSAARAREVVFDLPGPLDVMVDGEVVPLHLQRLDVLHHALEVIA